MTMQFKYQLILCSTNILQNENRATNLNEFSEDVSGSRIRNSNNARIVQSNNKNKVTVKVNR